MNAIRRINGIALSVAVILVLGYLVARPHLTTIYVEDFKVRERMTERGSEEWVARTEFSSSPACAQAVKADIDALMNATLTEAALTKSPQTSPPVDVVRYRCRPEVRLVWGW